MQTNSDKFDEIKRILKKENYKAYIIDILEDDFGCEERQDNESLKVILKILTLDGIKYVRAEDEFLIKNNMNAGDYIDRKMWEIGII